MKPILITELLDAFSFSLSHGMENALRVFPRHRDWLLQQEGKTFRQVERELLTKSQKLHGARKEKKKPRKLAPRIVTRMFSVSQPIPSSVTTGHDR